MRTPESRSAPFAEHEPGEPGHRDILAGAGVDRHDHVADRFCLVLDELLVEQDDLAEPGVQLAFGDLLLHVDRLLAHLRHVNPFLFFDGGGRHVLAADVLGVDGHDVEGQVLGELLEFVVAGDEIGLAVELDQGARLGVVVDVDFHPAGLGGPAGAELGLLEASFLGEGFRLGDVSVGLFQKGLALHEAQTCLLAKLVNGPSRDFGHRRDSSILVRTGGAGDWHFTLPPWTPVDSPCGVLDARILDRLAGPAKAGPVRLDSNPFAAAASGRSPARHRRGPFGGSGSFGCRRLGRLFGRGFGASGASWEAGASGWAAIGSFGFRVALLDGAADAFAASGAPAAIAAAAFSAALLLGRFSRRGRLDGRRGLAVADQRPSAG